MAYKINKTDGSLLTELIDSAINQTATDLTLIGKNVTGYGEYINENFVKLLENFASSTEPNFPITGQLWYDLTENRLKIYDGNGFKIGNGPVISSTLPTNLTQGDFWIDNKEKQLYFYDGLNLFSASKIWKESQGKSGFEPRTIKDQFGNSKTVVLLWSANTLLGIFSHYPEFVPENASGTVVFENATYTGPIFPGFNPNENIEDFKFNVATTKSESLIDSSGNLKFPEDFMFRDESNELIFDGGTTSPSLSIASPYPLKLGRTGETSIFVDSSKFQIKTDVGSIPGEQDFIVTIRDPGNFEVDALTVKANSNRLGVFNNNPQATLDVGGNVIIAGNLTVGGSTTTITTNDLIVEDKNIELAFTASPTDVLANNGGIVLKGTTDKTLTWVQSTNSWTSNVNFNLTSGNFYKINGVNVLSQTNLLNITDALDLRRIGRLDFLEVDDIILDNNVLSVTGPTMVLDVVTGGLDRVIQIGNTIDVTNGFARITNVKDPFSNQDVATKNYVDVRVGNVVGTAWQEIGVVNSFYNANSADRLLVNTLSQVVTVGLPLNPQIGDNIRFIDLKGTFDLNNLVIARYRTINSTSYLGTAAPGSVNVYLNVPTISVTGTGTGFTADVNVQAEGIYTLVTVAVVPNNPGRGYRSGDVIRILGSNLGGVNGINDLTFALQMVPILGIDEDLVVDLENAAIGLYFSGVSEGWKYIEKYPLPEDIYARFFGDLEGDVTGDLFGQVMIANQPNITTLGTLTNLEVQGTITGNLVGNTTGIHFGNVEVTNQLTVQSTSNSVRIRASNQGIILATTNPTNQQEQFAMQITGGLTPTVPNTINLFGNVIVDNLGPNSTNGASFRLPTYTTILRNARTSAGQANNGELIYNVDVHKVQVYANGIWVDLH